MKPTKYKKRLKFLIKNNWPRAQGQLIKEYLSSLVEAARPAVSIVRHYHWLNKFAKLSREATGLSEQAPIDTILLYIDRPIIETNIKKLRSECISSKSFRDTLSAVRTFYNWLFEQGHIDHNPIAYLPHNKPKRPTLTLEQIRRKRKEPSTGISLIRAAEQWLAYNKRHSKHTQRHYHDVILAFLNELPGSIKTVKQLSPSHLRDFITGLLSRGHKNSTVNTHFIALQSFCRWLNEQYGIDNIAEKIRTLKTEKSQARFLTIDEYKKILAVCHGREKYIIELLFHTGLRSSELVNLKWENVSTDYRMINLSGKGRKFRHIPCNQKVRDILKEYQRLDDSEKIQLFEYYPHRDSIYNLCRKLTRKAGIKRFGPHAIRHLFATELLTRGVAMAYVSKVLGHSSFTTTERLYVHWQPDYLNGVTDVLLK